MSKRIIKVAGLVVVATLMGFSIADASLLKDSAFRRVKAGIVSLEFSRNAVQLSQIPAGTFTATQQGDVYFVVFKGGKEFAYVRDNALTQNLEIVPKQNTGESDHIDALAFAYEYLNEIGKDSVRILTMRNVDLFESHIQHRATPQLPAGVDVLKENFEMGSIKGTKEWHGDDAFFQLTYKIKNAAEGAPLLRLTFRKAETAGTGGRSIILRPDARSKAFIIGAGTVGTLHAQALRQAGFDVGIAKASVDGDMVDLVYHKGFTSYAISEKQMAEMEKKGIPHSGLLKARFEQLKAQGIRPLFVDATPGEDYPPKPEQTGGVQYKSWGHYYQATLYDPYNAIGMYQGGEAEDVPHSGITYVPRGSDPAVLAGVNDVRQGSCNTTATVIAVTPILEQGVHAEVRGTYIRRDTDRGSGSGIHGVENEAGSHHYGDVVLSLRPELRKYLVAGDIAAREATAQEKQDEFAISSDAVKTSQQFSHLIDLTVTIRSAEDHAKLLGKSVAEIQSMKTEDLNKALVEKIKTLFLNEARLALIAKGSKMKTAEIERVLVQNLQVAHWYLPVFQVAASNIRGDVKVTIAVPQDSIVSPNVINVADNLLGMFNPKVNYRLSNEIALNPTGFSLVDLKRRFESIFNVGRP
jgi:hypothetical protein